MDSYVNDLSKMALALTSAQMAKDAAVKEHGVGEDIAVHFLGWAGDELIIICQMKDDVGRLDPLERFARCKDLCAILRRYWWVTSITMVSEGYCSMDAQATKDVDLASAFTDSSLPVLECVAVTHASIADYGAVTPVSMVAAPYSFALGRSVKWMDTLVYPESATSHIKQHKYPAMLRRSLMEGVEEVQEGDQMTEVRALVDAIGFFMQEFY